MRLLFDVHCAGTYLGSRAEIDKNHEVICVGQVIELPQDMKDKDIMGYAQAHDYMVVTKDVDLVRLCCENNIPVAVLKGNHVFPIKTAIKIIGRDPPKELFSQN
jgi:predicted nuclease of predicted toxin-antitoxin system